MTHPHAHVFQRGLHYDCGIMFSVIPARQRVYLKVTEEPLLGIRDTFLRNGERDDRFFERYGTVCCKTGCHPLLKRAVNLKKELRIK